MIDYTKFVLIGIDLNKLLDNPLLSFRDTVEQKTGLLGTYQQANYKGLTFKVYYTTEASKGQRRITLEGSLHKFWNDGKHNFNDFGINELFLVLRKLKNDFDIKPINCHIKQLEIGLNLIVSFEVSTFLSCCIMHKTTPFKWCKTRGKGHYIQAEYQRYIIKIYDKGTQYRNKKYQIENEILRIEIKYRNMEDLRAKHSIYTLENLLNFEMENFNTILIEEWGKVIFFEKEIFTGNKYEYKYNNFNFWNDLTPENFKYHRREMNKKIQKHSNNTKGFITELIQTKGTKLMQKLPKLNINV